MKKISRVIAILTSSVLVCLFSAHYTIRHNSNSAHASVHHKAKHDEHLLMVPVLHQLLNDMKLYKLHPNPPLLHAGDLYEHSIWAYYAMVALFMNDSPFTAELALTPREQEIVALAVLLHDIGKAGRKELFAQQHARAYQLEYNAHGISKILYESDHQEHTKISFEYLAQPFIKKNKSSLFAVRDYQLADGSLFNFDELFNQLGVTSDEHKLISILAGMHYEFGNVTNKKITPHEFLNKLQKFVTEVHYNNGIVNQTLVRLAIAVQAADVKGLLPVQAQVTPLFEHTIEPARIHPTDIKNACKDLSYECADSSSLIDVPYAVEAMHQLLEYFKNSYTYNQKN